MLSLASLGPISFNAGMAPAVAAVRSSPVRMETMADLKVVRRPRTAHDATAAGCQRWPCAALRSRH